MFSIYIYISDFLFLPIWGLKIHYLNKNKEIIGHVNFCVQIKFEDKTIFVKKYF